ncbi:fungal-specific transcription factor domain-containing protein, partial [Scheffersomyces xylosifermentans]|uniref:fungal-specific transcription factor domain-containing protein n=1 Tax=Scheffersomyces xylosifermentans TaxID=1304137 RepID=UPI00315D5AAA
MPPKKRKLSGIGKDSAQGEDSHAEQTLSASAITSAGESASILGVSRSISACQRCRQKKVKCDQRFPKCSKCDKYGVECIGLDPMTGREVPRSYIVHLENRVNLLEQTLKNHKIGIDTPDQKQENAITNENDNNENIASHQSSQAGKTKTSSPLQEIGSSPTTLEGSLDGVSTITFSRLMSTAVKVQRKSMATFQNPIASRKHANNTATTIASSDVLPAILPPKTTALQFISIFFAQANSQMPIMHREEFIKRYFIPIYGHFDHTEISLASDYSTINSSFFQVENQSNDIPWFDRYKEKFQSILGSKASNASNDEVKKISNSIVAPKKYRRGLYFLNMVFAISSSVNLLQYPISISDSFRLAASKYFDDVYGSLDQLESLQGILLYSLYSTMRPANPGVWHTLGSALRMCVDLDLHNERNTTTANNIDSFTRDKRRRLFWCTYCSDRQICFYLDRPVGIPDESINTPFPSSLDDALIQPGDPIKDYSQITNDLPSYKSVFLSMIHMREIQSEVQRVLYTNFEIPRRYTSLDAWKSTMLTRLKTWLENTPTTPRQMNCDFNLAFFMLNYYHTLLMIHGLSPKNYKLSNEDYNQVSTSSRKLISIYASLCSTKSINYTWAAVHNLFMAGTSFLYAIYNSEEIRKQNSLAEVKRVTSDCLNILNSLSDNCEAASNCVEIYHALTMV